MLARPIILNARAHASLRLRPQQGFGFAGQLHMAAVMQPEFVRVAALYPIVFVEDRSFDSFRPMALLGLKTGENLFVGADGRLGATYVPAVVRAHPFALGPAAPGDHIAVCVDAAATTTEPGLGVALFDPQGQPAPALREAMAFLSRLRQMQVLTDAFCRALAERNLFTPFRGGRSFARRGSASGHRRHLVGALKALPGSTDHRPGATLRSPGRGGQWDLRSRGCAWPAAPSLVKRSRSRAP